MALKSKFEREYFQFSAFPLKLINSWPTANPTLKHRISASLNGILLMLFGMSSLYAGLLELQAGEFLFFADAMAIGWVVVPLSIKFGIFIYKSRQFDEILVELQKFISKHSHPTVAAELDGRKKLLSKLNLMYYMSSVMTSIFLLLIPFLVNAVKYFVTNQPFPLILPIKSWWPWDVNLPVGFFVAYFVLFIQNCMVPGPLTGIDNLILNILIYSAGMFHSISSELHDIGCSIAPVQLTSTGAVDVEPTLRKLVIKHVKAIKFCKKLQSTFQSLMLVHFLSAVAPICFGGFIMLIAPEAKWLMTYSFYCAAVFLQAYFYCWGGNEITEAV